jgi:hypothetical protein
LGAVGNERERYRMSDPVALVERLYKAGLVSRKFRDMTIKNIKKAMAAEKGKKR